MTTLTLSTAIANSLFAATPNFLDSSTARIGAWVIGLLVVLAAAWGAYVAIDYLNDRQRRKDRASSENVFEDICAAQGLTAETKKRLLDAATELELISPALLFVDSALLNRLAASDREDAREFAKLAEQLFPSTAKSSESEEHKDVHATAVA